MLLVISHNFKVLSGLFVLFQSAIHNHFQIAFQNCFVFKTWTFFSVMP